MYSEKALRIKVMDLEGHILSYRLQGDTITIIKENQSIKIPKDQIDMTIKELTELKEVVNK